MLARVSRTAQIALLSIRIHTRISTRHKQKKTPGAPSPPPFLCPKRITAKGRDNPPPPRCRDDDPDQNQTNMQWNLESLARPYLLFRGDPDATPRVHNDQAQYRDTTHQKKKKPERQQTEANQMSPFPACTTETRGSRGGKEKGNKETKKKKKQNTHQDNT